MNKYKKYIYITVISAYVLVGLVVPLTADAISLSASGTSTYIKRETDNPTGLDTTSELYIDSVNAIASARVTEVINVSGSVAYTHIRTKTTTGNVYIRTEYEDAHPYLNINFNPPKMFYLTFGMSRSHNYMSEGYTIITTNSRASFSILKSKLWPSLMINYNKNFVEDTRDPKLQDNETQNFSLSSSYSGTFKQLKYGANAGFRPTELNESKNNITGNTSQIGSLSFGGNVNSTIFKKVNATLSLSYNEGNRILFNKGISGISSLLQTPLFGYINVDNTPTLGTLTNVNAVVDNDIATSTGFDIDSTVDVNVGVEYGTDVYFDTLQLHVTTLSTNINGNDFTFEVYQSADGNIWTLMNPGSGSTQYNVSYNENNLRFDFKFLSLQDTTTYQHIKIVNRAAPGTYPFPINITELSAYDNESFSSESELESESSSSTVNLSLSYAYSSRLSTSYNLSLSHGEATGYNNKTSSSDFLSQSLRVSATAIPKYLILSSGVSLNTSKSEGESGSNKTKSESRSFRFSANSRPLDAISLSASYNSSQLSRDGDLLSENSAITFSTSAMVRSGINVSYSMLTSQNSSYGADEILSRESEVFSNGVSVGLQPWRFMNINYNFSSSESTFDDKQDTSPSTKLKSEASSVNVSVRPSSSIVLFGNFVLKPKSSETYSLSWRITQVMNLNAGLSISDESVRKSIALNWNPFPRFSTSVNYNITNNKTTDVVNNSLFLTGSISF